MKRDTRMAPHRHRLALAIPSACEYEARPVSALPTLARDLAVHASTAVLVVTVYQLVLVMTLLPFSAPCWMLRSIAAS